MFKPLPSVPDHPALEREVLERWEEERTFQRLREQNAGGPRFSFIDGPITANNPMGVHHAWGRTLKDVFQRYNGATGHDERYQNGFDCQGLWVEVEVEKELGLNSKREIEEYGIAEFARALQGARRAVRRRDDRAVEAPRPVDGLGQRLPHLLGHEHRVHLALPEGVPRARVALQGPPLDAVVPALRHLALAARAGRRGELPRARAPVAVRPLPAGRPRGRVAGRLDDDAVDAARERRRGRQAGRRVRPARRRLAARRGGRRVRQRRAGRGPGRARVPRRPSTTCPRRRASPIA